MNVHSSLFIRTNPNVHRQENGYTMVYSYTGILHSNKQERTIGICSKVGEFQTHCVEQNKLHTQEYTLHDSTYMKF